jgi:hypothetical protein
LISYSSDLDIFPIFLIVTGAVLIVAVCIVDHYRKKSRRTRKLKESAAEAEKTENLPVGKPNSSAAQPADNGRIVQRHKPALQTLDRRPHVFIDLFRVLLIPLSLIVAVGFILILLPQSTTDKFVQDLQFRSSASGSARIAFLYLGHQQQNDELKIRGVVRNITTDPIEQLDAAVRLYSSNGDLLETAIVRMDKETLDPDEIARFELVYPEYGSEFSSYSVEFKLRSGEVVPYKDMRQQSDGNLQ